jgi:2-amino-4-hydroxy-6-hydroxymethyldihydropteridine diphosphokinase
MKIVLGFGSNLGDREEFINTSYKLLEERLGIMIKKSLFIETPAWGFESENKFLNSVAIFQTNKTPIEALRICNQIEKELGRIREGNTYQNRTIDIDILFYEDMILNTPELIIPHPLIQKRDFVLIPLKEILHDYVHPLLKKKIKDI